MNPLDANGLVFGRYRLIERIAAGGMGEVYIALQTGIGQFSRPIAVKLLLPHLADDPKSVSMFLTEARIGAQLTHANIVQVYDVGLENDRYFIAMELVRGVALSKLIAGLKGNQEFLSVELLAWIGRCLCDGLHVAHEATGPDGQPMQLVHRDVTPHNVLVSVDGAVKLTDFGIARVADADRLSRPGVVMGKLGYLAPEQITGQVLDRRVDLFAAGATMYHLAALEKPFDTPTGASFDPSRLPTVPLRVCRPDLPRSVVDAIEQAMHPDASQRFATAKEFRNAWPVPGPDVADELGRLLRRVCGAALIELEHKTERATQAIGLDERRADRETRPSQLAPVKASPVAPALTSSLPLAPPKKERWPVVVLAFAVVALTVAVVGLWVRGAPTELVQPPLAPVTAVAVADAAVAARAEPAPIEAPVEAVDAGHIAVDSSPGLLTIDASPWANITLDGRPLGETPLANVRVSPGVHTISATNPENQKTIRKTVMVGAGRSLPVRFDLR